MRIRGIGLCVLLVGNAVSQEWADFFAPNPEKRIASWKADFQDPEKLKEPLRKYLMRTEIRYPDNKNLSAFREKFDVTDENIRAAMMSIYRETVQQLAQPREGNPNYSRDGFMCHQLIGAMGTLADEPMKRFLLGLAQDNTTQPALRGAAAGAYLGCADAQEVKDFFVYFLADNQRFPEYIKDALWRYTPYEEKDKCKRKALLECLYVAAAQEEDWRHFEQLDWFLTTRRAEDYLASYQRVALLQKHYKFEPVDVERGDIPTLKDRLDSMQDTKNLSNVSTNLTELKKRDFRKPVEEGGQ